MANNNKVFIPSSVSRSHESELESIKNKVGSEGVSSEDLERAKSIISTILSEKELGALVRAIESGNKQIQGLNSAVSSSSKAVNERVEGNIFGLITASRLKEILQIQEKEQVKKGGPYYLISESIKTVNDNLGHTARIIKAVLQLQLITMVGVLKNAEVETNRAQKLARLSERLKTSDLNLEELLDYSLELDDYASHIDLNLNDVRNEVITLNKEVERIHLALTTFNDTLKKLSQKIKDAQVAAETKSAEQLTEAEKRLIGSISDARVAAETKAAEQLTEAEKRLIGNISDARVAAETKAAEQLTEAEKRLTSSISDARVAAETKATEQLTEVEKRLIGSISDTRVAAETKAAEQLTEAEKRLIGNIFDAQVAVETKAKEQLVEAVKSINEKILRIQQNALESIKANSEATYKNVAENHNHLRRKIILSYIIGSIGIICSAVILALSLFHII